MPKLELGSFTITYDDFCMSFNDKHSEVYLDIRDLPKLRAYLDGVDDYLSNKNAMDEDDWLPEDIYGNNEKGE